MNTRQMARALGRRGGLARARNLTRERRRRIAALGGAARKRSLQAARRMAANDVYAAIVRQLRPPPPVERMKSFDGPLPGHYLDRG
jgi:hypothetical protein